MSVPAKLRSKDINVRIAVTRALLTAGVDRAAIRHEITIDTSSSDGRADMVLALDHAIAGIEIKSGKDTLDRLDLQHGRYQTHFDRAMLVADIRFRPCFEYGAPIRYERWEFLRFHNSEPDGAHEFDWSYGITCHKSQGSEWPHVTIADDSAAFRTPDMMRRWRYTAITRAAEGLTLLRRAA